MTATPLATGNYRRFTPDWGTPVQISNGRPKYLLPYTLVNALPNLYPSRQLMQAKNMPMSEFTERYQRDLDGIGLDRIATQLDAIATKTRATTLVLLCFETSPDQCHRGSFAAWWERNTGEHIPEMGAPPPPTYEQLAFNFEEM